jgi:hypothetical protein
MKDIELLGSNEKIQWNYDPAYLKIEIPDMIPNKIAIIFKVYPNY